MSDRMRMNPEMMRTLLGGAFPDTGFDWGCVTSFYLVDGIWEPHEGEEILPADGFLVTAVEATQDFGERA